jgi:hypothetical protein
MSTPTEYDKVQDAEIEALKEITTTSYTPPDQAEYSFPIPNHPVNQEEFQLLSLVDGNGIIDRGDYPYWLEGHGSDSETNAQNSMILKVGQKYNKAEAVVAGFFHVLTQDKTIPLPAVTTETKYRICLTNDPREEEGRLGPVSVQVYTTEPPTTFARVSTTLYTVTRKPNQLLTDATIERFRPRTVAPIAVLKREHLPDPANVLFGSVAFIYGENDIVIARGASTEEGGPNRWDSMFTPDVSIRGDSESYEWAGSGDRFRSTRIGNLVILEGRLKRTNGEPFRANNSNGYKIRNLPPEHSPRGSKRFVTKSDGFDDKGAVINIGADGAVLASPRQDCTWVSVDGISYTVGN